MNKHQKILCKVVSKPTKEKVELKSFDERIKAAHGPIEFNGRLVADGPFLNMLSFVKAQDLNPIMLTCMVFGLRVEDPEYHHWEDRLRREYPEYRGGNSRGYVCWRPSCSARHC